MVRNHRLRTEVDVILRRLRVQPHRERGFLLVKVVPPGERRLAGFDPGRIGQNAGCVKVEHEVRLDESLDLVGDHEDTPRRVVRQIRADRDIRFAGPWGQPAVQDSPSAGVASQVHPGVVGKVGLHHREPAGPRQLGEERQAEEPCRGNLGHRLLLIANLMGGGVAIQRERICLGVARQLDLAPIAGDREALRALLGGKTIAYGDSVVVGPHGDLPAPRRCVPLAQHDDHFFAMIDDPAALARILFIGFVDRPRPGPLDRRVMAKPLPVGQVDAQPRREDDGPPAIGDGICRRSLPPAALSEE